MKSAPDRTTLIPTEELPTVIAMTAQALVSEMASETPDPATLPEVLLSPTVVSTPTPTLTTIVETGEKEKPTVTPLATGTPLPPFEIPYAHIQILSPGALSQVISPIRLHAFLIPGDSGRALVELFGEDGRLMYRKLFIFSSPPGVQTNLRTDIEFEIQGVAETANLVINVDDAYGRLKALASEDLILITLGDSDINPSGDHLAPIIIQEPFPDVLVQGETLVVSGLVRTTSVEHLLVELVTTEGKLIGSRVAGISAGSAGDHRLFAAEVPYTVLSPTWVRVTVSEWNRWQSGPAQLASVEVLLGP